MYKRQDIDTLNEEMRRKGWDIKGWTKTREDLNIGTGTFGDKQNIVQISGKGIKGVITSAYADDTQSKCAHNKLDELERINAEGITRVCEGLKSLRLKVNEEKTVYLLVMSSQRRTAELNLKRRMETEWIDVKLDDGQVTRKQKSGPGTCLLYTSPSPRD